MRQAWRLLGLLLAVLLAGCGPVPRPFMAEGPNPLLEDRVSLAPLSIAPVEGLPGLDLAMIAAFEPEDIAATLDRPGPGALRLEGTVEGRTIVWRLSDRAGKPVGQAISQFPAGPTKVGNADIASASVRAISRTLRGEGSGLADIEAQPHIALPPVKAPKDVDGSTFNRAMTHALAGLGMTVSDDSPVARVEGTLRITPQSGSKDLVEIEWKVLDAKGNELGIVSQGGPTDRMVILGSLGTLARQISDAGAPGVAEVIRKRALGH